MRGGNSRQVLADGAARIAEVALSVLLVTNQTFAEATTSTSLVIHTQATQVAGTEPTEQPVVERSILVAKGADSQPLPAPITSTKNLLKARRQLEPIAKFSQLVPELADPQPTEVSVEPDLAVIPEPTTITPERIVPVTPTEELPEEEPLAEVAQESKSQNEETFEIESVTFHGITPGISLLSEVLSDWGNPLTEDKIAGTLTYKLDGLESVELKVAHERVQTISIILDKPTPVSEMIESLELEGLRTVDISDAKKSQYARVFPERAVVLTLSESPDTAIVSDGDSSATEPQVSEILLQTVGAEPFLLRARDTGAGNLSRSIADLERVVELERNSAEAKFLLAGYHLSVGRAITAERYAAEAVELEPGNHEYRLQWTKCLSRLAKYDQAVAESRRVLESTTSTPLDKSQALEEMAQLASLGSKEVARRSIPLHSRAIEIADKYSNSDDRQTRQRAQGILIDSHLAIAAQIAQGNFQDKNQAVPQWIERASGLAEALIEEDSTQLPRRLQVAVSALAAAVGLEKPINPRLWIEEAEETVKFLEAEFPDRLTCSQYDWQLGLAYLYAADIEHLRSQVASAKKFGKLAERKLSELSRQRDELPDTGYTMGRLYFQIGAVYAVHEKDHVAACKWYDQAAELLLNPVPVTTLSVPQQHGDALVSMGVSYWRSDDQQRAVELTLAGVELIEQAVDAELLGASSLSVPYGNLSAMYQALGKTEPAARYEQLARKATGGQYSE